jgi:hypothetical protein
MTRTAKSKRAPFRARSPASRDSGRAVLPGRPEDTKLDVSIKSGSERAIKDNVQARANQHTAVGSCSRISPRAAGRDTRRRSAG